MARTGTLARSNDDHVDLDFVEKLNELAAELREISEPSSLVLRLLQCVEYTVCSKSLLDLKKMTVRDQAKDIGSIAITRQECIDAIGACVQAIKATKETAAQGGWDIPGEKAAFLHWKHVVGFILMLSQMVQRTEFAAIAPLLLDASSRKAIVTASESSKCTRHPIPSISAETGNRNTISITLPKQAQDADVVVVNCQVEMRQNAQTNCPRVSQATRSVIEVVMKPGRSIVRCTGRSLFSLWSNSQLRTSGKRWDKLPKYEDVFGDEKADILIEKAGLHAP